jgi:hypothetical protein
VKVRKPNEPVVIGGDFNTDRHSDEALKILGQIVDTVEPFPVDSKGKVGTNRNRDKPYDGIYATKDIEAKEVPVKLASREFPAGFVVDTREMPQEILEAIAPARREDSNAKDMQHNGVIRDFNLAK